jgi:phosphoglycolate phosphatase-like HAD superfamily hydrolase
MPPASLQPTCGLIFDFDGPLFDGRSAARKALEHTIEHFSSEIGRPIMSFETLPLLDTLQMVGLVYSHIGPSSNTLRRIRAFYKKELTAIETKVRLTPAVAKALHYAVNHGISLGVFSGRRKADVKFLLTQLGCVASFDVIVGCDLSQDVKPSGSA